MKMLQDEAVLLSLAEGALIVTTHRVHRQHEESGFSFVTSLMLEDVTSCEVSSESAPWLIGLAVIVLMAALVSAALMPNRNMAIFAVIAGVAVAGVAAAAYFSTKRTVIDVKSPSACASLGLKGIPTETVQDFIDTLSSAKDRRFRLNVPIHPPT